LVFADAIVLSRRVDGVIVVIQAGKSKRAAIVQTLFDLQNANANLLGSIFNQSPQSDTFSVNKAYMQERPQLPSPRLLEKKEKTSSGQFHDLRDAAKPLSGSLESKSEESKVVAAQVPDVTEVVQPERKEEVVGPSNEARHLGGNMRIDNKEVSVETSQFYDLEFAASLLESAEIDNEEVSLETSQFHDLAEPAESEHTEEAIDLTDAVTPLNVSLELEKEETIVEETQFHGLGEESVESKHKEEIVDVGGSESQAKVSEGKSRKRRSRKNRNNGHRNEEVHIGENSTSTDYQANFPKNGKDHAQADEDTKDPVDQTNE